MNTPTTEPRTLRLSGFARLDVAAAAADDADRPAAGDREARKLPTVRIVAYSGGQMTPNGGWGPLVVDLAGVSLPATLPLLADHDVRLRSILGGGRPAVQAGKLVVDGRLVPGGQTDRLVELAAAKVPIGASIGMSVERTEFVEAGERVRVNGKNHKAGRRGLTVVREAELREVSIVGVGADREAHAVVTARKNTKGTATMARDTLHTPADDDHPADLAASGADFEPGPREAAEADRIDAIKAFARQYDEVAIVEHPTTRRVVKAASFIRSAIANGLSPADVECAFLKAQRANGVDTLARPAIIIRRPLSDQPDEASAALECAILRDHFNIPTSRVVNGDKVGLEAMYDERTLTAADNRELRHVSLQQLMGYTLDAAGMHYSGNRRDFEFGNEYVRAAQSLQASGGPFSTLTVGHVLENVANKALLARFQLAAPLWPRIARTQNLNDFKPASLYRLDGDLGYRPLNPQGEIVHGSLEDTKRTIAADTHARMISLDRHHIVNDDLGAFTQVVHNLADGAVWAIESEAARVLLANADDFFGSGNGNLIDAPLGLAGLEEAETAFRSHVGAGGKPIVAEPAIVLVGSALATSARAVLGSAQLLSVDGNASNVVALNPFAGRFSVAVWRYLDGQNIRTPSGAALPNQSASKWYLLSEPAAGSVLVVGLLNGRAMPTIQSSETSFNTLGMQWRGYHDFGVAQGDHQYGVMSTGDGLSG